MTEDNDAEGGESNGSWRDALAMVVPLVVMFLLVVVVFGGFSGYMDHLEAQGTEAVCEEQWGEASEYVGDTGFTSDTGICDTPEGQKYVDTEMAPVGVGTFLDYVGLG